MGLKFAYLAGLLALINSCVLPVVPVVLASSLHRDRCAPLVIAAGMSLSFVALGLGLAALGPAIGPYSDVVARGAALAMAGLGLVILLPALSGRFSAATAGIAAQADAQIDATSDAGLSGQFLSGALLGTVWSPCIGPTLGVSTLILGLAYRAKSAIRRRQHLLRRMADLAKPVMGMTFIGVGLALWFGLHYAVEGRLLRTPPTWLIDFSVSI